MSRTRRARWVAAVLAGLALVGAVPALAGTAHAASSVTDSFEGNPYERWTPYEVAGHTRVLMGNDARARTGNNLAFLNSWPMTPAEARIYLTVTLDRPSPGPTSCYPEAYLRRAPSVPEPGPQGVWTNLRIREGGADGPVLSHKGYTVWGADEWERVGFHGIPYRSGPLTIEIGAYEGTLLVDDFTMRCIRDPQ